MPTNLEAARSNLHDATPPGGFVGRPAESEVGVIRELARCLRLIWEVRVPE